MSASSSRLVLLLLAATIIAAPDAAAAPLVALRQTNDESGSPPPSDDVDETEPAPKRAPAAWEDVDDVDDEDGEDTPRGKKRKRGSDDDEESGSQSFFDYLKMALTFESKELAEEVDDGVVGAWILGALFNGIGGHIWGPMIFYKDAPKNEPRKEAMILGGISTVLSFGNCALGVCNLCPLCLPIWIVPFYGWIATAGLMGIWAVVMSIPHLLVCGASMASVWYLMPRAISFAYTDAYAAGGDDDGGKRKSKAKKSRRSDDVEDDEEEEEDEDD